MGVGKEAGAARGGSDCWPGLSPSWLPGCGQCGPEAASRTCPGSREVSGPQACAGAVPLLLVQTLYSQASRESCRSCLIVVTGLQDWPSLLLLRPRCRGHLPSPGLPRRRLGKESACQSANAEDLGGGEGVGYLSGKEPTPVFLEEESHGQRRLEGCSPWNCWNGLSTCSVVIFTMPEVSGVGRSGIETQI